MDFVPKNIRDYYDYPELSEDEEMPSMPRESNPNWNGGRTVNARGYVSILMPDHPKANYKGYIYEHRVIAEKALGKPLPDKSVVHHHTPTELVLCQNQAYHRFLHQRMRAFNECGDVHKRKCRACQKWIPMDNFYGRHHICKPCSIAKLKEWVKQNPEKTKAYHRKYREEHRDQINARRREWRKRHAAD